MITRPRRTTEAGDPAWPIWLIVCLYGLCAVTNFRDLFALPWMIGRSDVVAWWVTNGGWAVSGGIALFLASVLTTAVYSHMRQPVGRKWVTLAAGVVALFCLLMAGRGRVEVGAEDLRIESEVWGRPAAIYRPEQASSLHVSCVSGRRQKIYPAFEVEFGDGAYMDLTPLIAPQGNRFGSRGGLRMAERFDSLTSARGERYVSDLGRRCVPRFARKMGADAPRVTRLFEHDILQVVRH